METKSDIVYVVNRVQISASEYNNGYTQTFLFRDKAKAEKRLKDLRSEDLTELDRLGRDYDYILTLMKSSMFHGIVIWKWCS